MNTPNPQETIKETTWAFEYAREMAVGSFDGDDYRLAEALANAITLLKAQQEQIAELKAEVEKSNIRYHRSRNNYRHSLSEAHNQMVELILENESQAKRIAKLEDRVIELNRGVMFCTSHCFDPPDYPDV